MSVLRIVGKQCDKLSTSRRENGGNKNDKTAEFCFQKQLTLNKGGVQVA